MKKKLEEMSIFELAEYKKILSDMAEKYNSTFTAYGLNIFYDDDNLTQNQKIILEKFNIVQSQICKIDEIMEEIVFKDYDK